MKSDQAGDHGFYETRSFQKNKKIDGSVLIFWKMTAKLFLLGMSFLQMSAVGCYPVRHNAALARIDERILVNRRKGALVAIVPRADAAVYANWLGC